MLFKIEWMNEAYKRLKINKIANLVVVFFVLSRKLI